VFETASDDELVIGYTVRSVLRAPRSSSNGSHRCGHRQLRLRCLRQPHPVVTENSIQRFSTRC